MPEIPELIGPSARFTPPCTRAPVTTPMAPRPTMPSTMRRPTGDPSLLTSQLEHSWDGPPTDSVITSANRHIFGLARKPRASCRGAVVRFGHDVAILILT